MAGLRTTRLFIKVAESEKASFVKAARKDGYLDLSEWVRQQLFRRVTEQKPKPRRSAA